MLIHGYDAAMQTFENAHCLGTGPDPIDVIAGWSIEQPLNVLLSARGGSPFARWSILAAPERTITLEHTPHESLTQRLDELAAPVSLEPVSDPDCPPFRGGNILMLSYELGRELEPRASDANAPINDLPFPLASAAVCPNALAHDRKHNVWWLVGADPTSDQAHSLRQTLAQKTQFDPHTFSCAAEGLQPELDESHYAALIARTIEFVHAGDVFQANIAQRFHSQVDLPSVRERREFAAALLARSGAWFGAMLEGPNDCSALSLSPELFLRLDPITRTITTRPIKGTLPGGEDPDQLLASDKDKAELAMIVDLMRNDLGRICNVGSIRVTDPRSIETHPGVVHGVAEICGTLAESVGLGALLAATFPPGSITGAPKIRAMQIIDELEPASRGPYCGAIGFASTCGTLELDVSIRTALLVPSETDYSHRLLYGAGCGIVAQSTPLGEVRESRAKAALLAEFLRDANAQAESSSFLASS